MVRIDNNILVNCCVYLYYNNFFFDGITKNSLR